MLVSFLDHHLSADQIKRHATTASLCVALLLVTIKLVGYFATDSMSLLSSLVDSASDVVASLVTYIGVRTALRPADEGHRYGHGKAEAMAALGTAAFVTGSATFMLIEAVGRIIDRTPVMHGHVGIGIMVISLGLTYALVWFQKYVVKRTGSTAIAADSVHYAADFMMNAAVIVALLLTTFTGFYLIDAFFGIGIAAWLVWKVVPVARDAVNMLMDHELPEADRKAIEALAAAHPQVLGVHDMRTRQSGTDIFVELHLEFAPQMPLLHVHAIGMQIEQAVRQSYRGADVVIHFDPAGVEEHRRDDEIRQQVQG